MKHKRRILLAVLVMIALGVFWVVLAHHQAKNALQKYRQQLAAQGEKLTVAELAPHYNDEEKAAAHLLISSISQLLPGPSNFPPAMKILVPGHALACCAEKDLPTSETANFWRDAEAELALNASQLGIIREMLKKTPGGFSLDYNQALTMPLSHLAPTKRAAMWFALAAHCDLHEGRLGDSLENMKTCFASARVLERDPVELSQLVRVAIFQIGVGVTWEMLQTPGWRDEQLADLQSTWNSLQIWNSVESSLEMDRANLPKIYEMARSADTNYVPASQFSFKQALGSLITDPKGTFEEFMDDYPKYYAWKWSGSYADELFNTREYQAGLDTIRKLRDGRAIAPAFKELNSRMKQYRILLLGKDGKTVEKSWGGRGMFLSLTDGIMEVYLAKCGRMEMAQRLVVTAIALKRFHAANGKYPEKLEQLVPRFLNAVPLDAMDGNPLRYQLQPNGNFLLYSVGEDGVDNGGDPTPVAKSGGVPRMSWQEARDAVWPVPATPDEITDYKQTKLKEWKKLHQVPQPVRVQPK